ncbi:MAG: rod shape-determining protein MreD [Acetobacteraceae bacterium]|nr:rod shape-determining protein MreD [Acetobacteraceae bacterium]
MAKGRPEPPSGFTRRLDAAVRGGFPAVSTAALLVMAAVPVGMPGLIAAAALPGVFFWTIFRPGSMPPPVVFALGLLQDLLSFAPLGVGVLTLLLVHGLALRWRDVLVKRSFLAVWLVFCGFAAGAAGLAWGLTAVLNWQSPPVMPGLLQLGLAVGLYPALAWAMSRIHRIMRRVEGAA